MIPSPEDFIRKRIQQGAESQQKQEENEKLYAERREKATKERNEKTGGSLAGSTLAAVGAVGLGTGVLLGKVLEMAMRVDFDGKGIHVENKDATGMFSKGYDWAYDKKKAA